MQSPTGLPATTNAPSGRPTRRCPTRKNVRWLRVPPPNPRAPPRPCAPCRPRSWPRFLRPRRPTPAAPTHRRFRPCSTTAPPVWRHRSPPRRPRRPACPRKIPPPTWSRLPLSRFRWQYRQHSPLWAQVPQKHLRQQRPWSLPTTRACILSSPVAGRHSPPSFRLLECPPPLPPQHRRHPSLQRPLPPPSAPRPICGVAWPAGCMRACSCSGWSSLQATCSAPSAKGQTLAQKTWLIRVVDTAGQPITQARALLRYLLSWVWFLPPLAAYLLGVSAIEVLVLLFGWVAIWAILSRFHPERQFWHDALAGTRLVHFELPKK